VNRSLTRANAASAIRCRIAVSFKSLIIASAIAR
jgi:hypothetical protein